MKIDANIHAMAHMWRAVNADTGKEIHNAIWADEEARQCCVYLTGPNGTVETDDRGAPLAEILDVSVRLEWIGSPNVPMHIRRLHR